MFCLIGHKTGGGEQHDQKSYPVFKNELAKAFPHRLIFVRQKLPQRNRKIAEWPVKASSCLVEE